MWAEHRLWWAASESATPASTRASSSITSAQSRVESPEPPYSSGQQHAHRAPSSPSLPKTSRGNACFSSHSREWGASSALARTRGPSCGGAAAPRSARNPRRLPVCRAPVDAGASLYRRRHARLARAARGSLAGPRSALGVGRAARRAPRSARWPTQQPGAGRAHARSARRRRGRGAARPRSRADLGPALARLAPPHPRGARLRGPELLRARGRRLEGARASRSRGTSRSGGSRGAAARSPSSSPRTSTSAPAKTLVRKLRELVVTRWLEHGPHQGPHPGPLPQRHRVGRRHLRLRGGGAPLVRQAGRGPDRRPRRPGSRP